MKNRVQNIFPGFIILIFLFIIFSSNTNGEIAIAFQNNIQIGIPPSVKDTILEDTIKLPYPFKDNSNPYTEKSNSSPLYMSSPSNIKTEVEYDPITGKYNITEKIGSFNYRNPSSMTLDEYRSQSRKSLINNYWSEQRKASSGISQGESFLDKYLNPKLNVNIKGFDKIFGSNVIDIKPQGSAELIFGINISKIENPTLPIKLQRSTTFDFDMKIQMGVTGNIGDKMKVGINYNTEATFDFENQTTLSYTGNEDELIQSIEAGNVSLPLTGTLITGSQSLFGVKTALQFGKLRVTSVFSQQKSESSVIEIEGGAQIDDFELRVDEYESNRHFFLSHYFKDNYDRALQNLPVINTRINITKVEIWVTNKSGNFDNSRNIIGFLDLAEDQNNIYATSFVSQNPSSIVYPFNDLNDLYASMNTSYSGIRNINNITSTLNPLSGSHNFVPIIDYAKVENARLLSTSEYEINSKLGYISLSAPLNDDEILAVAFEYTLAGQVFTVGEFSNSGVNAPATLILKLLKGPALLPQIPNWHLMMKNVYSIGSYRINSEDFNLDIYYNNDKSGTSINYIDKGAIAGIPLLKVMSLDQLNSQLDPQPDGAFDFMERTTINSSNGRVFFPVREPFGSHLRAKINDDAIANEFVFEELYDSTQSKARQIAEKSKFIIKGSYKSSGGSDISLNAINIPEGSVKASANGVELTEGADYIVDYNLGRVTILNHGLLESGTPIQISLESNSLFNINRKTLLGTHLDYIISDNFTLGGTILHLSEKPLTNKVDIGDEPISNTIWGLSGNYSTDFPFLTKMIDKLPFIETKEMSTIEVSGEFAQLIPGHSKAIGEDGNSYIDDFEGAKTTIDLKTQYSWVLASTPKGQTDLFPEGSLVNDLQNGFNRAKLAWYSINTDLVRNTSATPSNITQNDRLSHLVREIPEIEIFPKKQSYTGYPTILNVTNIAFYPTEKGPYNYDVSATSTSAGINTDGSLLSPETRWGGIMRKLQTNDFEATNIEFIEFWLMDPFLESQTDNDGGDLYFNLGYISEDILNDSRKSFENGLPTGTGDVLVDTTVWGRVPLQQSLVNAFDNDPTTRQFQDVGMDGLSTTDERSFFADYLDQISFTQGSTSGAYVNANNDPSSDNYRFFRSSEYDAQNTKILERYKYFNGLEGNSPTSDQSPEPYPTSATLIPDVEDINQDNTLNEEETYFQYKVSLRPEDMEVGKNYITVMREAPVTRKDMPDTTVKWYLFKVPIYKPQRKIGPISDFRSIRFMRLFMQGFSEEIVLRFAKLDLVRSEWRSYDENITEGTEGVSNPQTEDETYDVSVVSIEENGSRTPVNYILPPGISRVVDPTNPYLRELNEQSISMRVIGLNDGDARSAYKNINIDIRQYKRLQMEVHGEALIDDVLEDDELSVFLRIGSDFKQNYYEYEIPIKLTPYRADYDNESEADRLMVWPAENRINFELELLQLVKQLRNDEMRRVGSNVELITPFIQYLNDNNQLVEPGASNGRRVVVMGNPNLSNVKTVMIGVRNPSKQNNPNFDDGMPKSGIVWLNELRVSDFRQEGGWASTARVSTKLADLGSFTIAGNTSRSGFGSLDKKINERQKEDIYAYDLSTNLEMGKFFPKKNRVRIPVYFGFSENVKSPQYNPLDPDILLKTTLSNPEISTAERDSIRRIVLDYTKRKSFNITNFKIEGDPEKLKGRKKPFYHISNFQASFAFNEIYSRSIKVDHSITRNHAGSFAYVLNNRPKNYTPFRKAKIFKHKSLKLFRDFNFYLMPTMFSFRTDLVRKYQENLTRNITEPDAIIIPTYRKDFTWNRNYDLKHSFSKALKFQYTANNKSRIDEPYGELSPNDPDYIVRKDSVWQSIMRFGRNTNFNHAIMLSYNLPLAKIPLLRWTSATARYKSTYDWTSGPLMPDRPIELGNIITNSSSIQLSGQFNFNKLYNKVPYLKRLSRKMKGGKSTKKYKDISYEKENLRFKKGVAKSIVHDLRTEDVQIEVQDENGKKIEGELIVISTKKVKFRATENYKNASIVLKGKREIKDNFLRTLGDGLAYMTIGLKNISVSYEQGGGTILPGYLPQTKNFGLINQNGQFAPGLAFIAGIQDESFVIDARDNQWLTTDSLQISPYVMTDLTRLSLKATLEPLKGLKIDLSAFKNSANSRNQTMVPSGNSLSAQNLLYAGSFSMSFLSINTAFLKYGENYHSDTYEDFKEKRHDIAWQLARERNDAILINSPNYDINEPNKDPITGADHIDGFPNGYGPVSQEVLIPAFLAAYSGYSSKTIGTSPFPNIPFPNWRVTYNGLTEISFLKRFFSAINLSHAYQSSYNVNSYNTNPFYNWNEKSYDGYSWARDEVNELFIPQHEINNITITEAFNPLISIDMTWASNLNTKVELRRARTMTLSFTNNQLIDLISSELIVGAGYRFVDLPIIIKTQGKQQKFQSDLNLRADFSFMKMLTIIRKLEEDVDQITAGQDLMAIRFSADYALNERFNLTLFYNQDINSPKISTSFKTSNTKFGVSVRFNLIP